MKKNIYNFYKLFTLIFFFSFIFSVGLITFLKDDQKISHIENKILNQRPKITFDSIISKRFMNNFDKFVCDQFPFRNYFVKAKNSFSYLIGNREFKDIYISKEGTLIEKYLENRYIINKNISKINEISKSTKIDSTLMLIPSSISFYSNTLPSWSYFDDQKYSLDYIESNIKEYSNFYTPYNIFKRYKHLPIYFNTDHHWTQLGANIAYNDIMNINFDEKSLINKYKEVSNDFYGTYFSKVLLNRINADIITSYNKLNNFDIIIDFNEKYTTLYNTDKLKQKNKYQYFLHKDFGFAIIDGIGKGEVLIFKDSYAHNFIPFLAYDFDKIHIIDPRYYKINLNEYLNDNLGINKIIFLHNLLLFNSQKLYEKY